MAKSIRSKAKRKNRTEFRNTLGTEIEKRNQAVIQEKLRETLATGQMNSFDRLSSLLSGKPTDPAADGEDDGDMVMTGDSSGKDLAKVPAKKKGHVKAGMYGDKRAKKIGERTHLRGKTAAVRGSRSGGGQRLRNSSKKRGGKKI